MKILLALGAAIAALFSPPSPAAGKADDGSERRNAKAVVVAIRADIFDPPALVAGGDGLDAHTPFVHHLAGTSCQ